MVKESGVWNNQWQKDMEQGDNRMRLSFLPLPQNEGFARVVVASFMTQLNPILEEVDDVKTAVSEAVTNSIIHGYESMEDERGILLEAYLKGRSLHIRIEDWGRGIENVTKAMEPLFTTRPELERSGMGFAFMEAFMDQLHVESEPGKGTVVYMSKQIGGQ